jgi:hypothetical protein
MNERRYPMKQPMIDQTMATPGTFMATTKQVIVINSVEE